MLRVLSAFDYELFSSIRMSDCNSFESFHHFDTGFVGKQKQQSLIIVKILLITMNNSSHKYCMITTFNGRLLKHFPEQSRTKYRLECSFFKMYLKLN